MKRGTVRLDRALSKLGAASRAQARRLVADGRVRVKGRLVNDPAASVVPETAQITVDGACVGAAEWRTLAFHKPRGVVTTRSDPQGRPTVFDLLGDDAGSLVAVGRLDLASTGLLLLTTDTQLANELTDPAREIVRRYVVTVRGELHDNSVGRMLNGIAGYRAHNVIIRKRSTRETHLIIELTEGKNREIRRLLNALNHEVSRLKRIAVGTIELGDLQPGRWREVSRAEIGRVVGRRLRTPKAVRHR